MSGCGDDVLLWSERQAALLRRRAAGELVNEAELDWLPIAGEIESVGQSELRHCRSFLRLALLHMLKAEAWPDSPAADGWRAEAVRFRHDAAEAFTPSMRHRIDLDEPMPAPDGNCLPPSTACPLRPCRPPAPSRLTICWPIERAGSSLAHCGVDFFRWPLR